MLKRRTFLKNISALAVAGLILPKGLFAMDKEKIIGIQLYTIRELVKNNFVGTLKILSEIGYKSVEAAGYSNGKFYDYSPKEYKNIVADLGLIPLSTHTSFSLNDAQKVIDDTLEAGMKYLIIPWLAPEKRKTLENYKALADEYNKIGEKCTASGLTFGYHNHAFEFEKIDDTIPYNFLLENTETNLVTMELDLYWMVYGGYQPLEYFKKYPGRFKLWHIKDMNNQENRHSTEIGSGIINFTEIFDMKKEAGMEYCFVEQESFDNGEAFWSIEKSFQYLQSLSNY
ncbi:MAG: TIM barrel protein [Bacteroidales bacterium]|nr:TIM barrel protein [Bacteroidales bacterium]